MILDALRKSVFLKYRNAEIARHELRYLFWECTMRCNLSCLHCGSDCSKNPSVRDMPLQDFLRAISGIKSEWPQKPIFVCITGGEPLLRPDLEDAGQQITSLGWKWGIVTNAMLLTRERFESLLCAGMSSASFSLDGFEREHNRLRQNPQSFQKAREAIENAVAVRRRDGNRFAFDVITCVHKGNLSILREFRDALIEMGVENWRIFSIFPEGRAAQNSLSLSNAEYRALLDFIAETRKCNKAGGKPIRLNYSCEGWLGGYELKVRDFFFFCRAGINVASIWCDGNVSGCLSVRAKPFVQGNIYREPFAKIWNEKFGNMRDRSWAKKGKCADCKDFKFCLGNGLHLHKDDCSECAHCNIQMLKAN